VDTLNTALKFIDALKACNINSDMFPPELQESMSNPVTGLLDLEKDRALRLSLRLFFLTINGAENQYDISRNAILEYDPSINVLTLDQCKATIQRLTGIIPIVTDMCPDSCMAFSAFFDECDKCLECGKDRYIDRIDSKGQLVRVAAQQLYTIPICSYLQALHSS
ncbi:hypothetical protein FA15DRAFT_556912, partial [Coprinopsis marcescibilis]